MHEQGDAEQGLARSKGYSLCRRPEGVNVSGTNLSAASDRLARLLSECSNRGWAALIGGHTGAIVQALLDLNFRGESIPQIVCFQSERKRDENGRFVFEPSALVRVWPPDIQSNDPVVNATLWTVFMKTHPNREAWKAYYERKFPRGLERKLRDHLQACEFCQEIVWALDLPLRILGRPVDPELIPDLEQAESIIEGLVTRVLCAPRRGQVVRVAADWSAETSMHHVIAAASARLRNTSGMSVQVETSWGAKWLPRRRGDHDVSVLLQAPGFGQLGSWDSAIEGRTAILIGWDRDWATHDQEVDFVLRGPNKNDVPERILQTWIAKIETSRDEVRGRWATLASGADLPRSDWELVATELPCTTVWTTRELNTSVVSVQGSWALAEAFLRNPKLAGKTKLGSSYRFPSRKFLGFDAPTF